MHDGVDRLLTHAPNAGAPSGGRWYEYTYDRADSRGVTSVNGNASHPI